MKILQLEILHIIITDYQGLYFYWKSCHFVPVKLSEEMSKWRLIFNTDQLGISCVFEFTAKNNIDGVYIIWDFQISPIQNILQFLYLFPKMLDEYKTAFININLKTKHYLFHFYDEIWMEYGTKLSATTVDMIFFHTQSITIFDGIFCKENINSVFEI